MNFFPSLLRKRNLNQHNGMPLWKYHLNKEELNDLKNTLKCTSEFSIDPRDVALYYAQWWQKEYNGGNPGKQDVFTSLEGNIRYFFDEHKFYKIAKQGADMLNVKWIKKQNTLYFKTLLLQGGLPLKHISENHGKYKSFLEAVLEEQPEAIEDFIFKTHITNLLPKSSQNDVIYENCFEIVKSILNEDGQFDELLNSDESLKEITSHLKIKKASLKRKVRQSKPKNYWLLSFKDDECKINLRLGLANKYTKEALSDILGFEPVAQAYQFYIEDNLICIFRKMTDGQFNTDWYNQENKEWNISDGLPQTYVIVDNKKVEITDFIQTVPNIEEPSLWSKFNDKEWRLLKGSMSPNKEAAVLFPSNWYSNFHTSDVQLFSQTLAWMPFEGEVIIESKEEEEEKRTFISGVNAFDWIIESKKPKWMLKSNIPVVQDIPKVFVYDDDGYAIQKNRFKVYTRKHNSRDPWEDISSLKFISTGCFDLKIEKEELVAHDVFFNIGNLQAVYSEQSIHSAKITLKNPDSFRFKLYESSLIQIEKNGDDLFLKVNTEFSKIPNLVKAMVGYTGKRKLLVDLISPFQGMAITDKEGQIIQEEQPLSLANIYGMRILSTPNSETLLKIKNSLQPDVIITKEIKESTQQLISFKDEIVRLFYLADAMEFTNTVTLELSEGRNKKKYKISGFSHLLDITNQLEKSLSLQNSTDKLELFAVPVNCAIENIEVIPMMESDAVYTIPETNISNQFIIISSKNKVHKLMPRFVYTSELTLEMDKTERIDRFHLELLNTKFNEDSWLQVLKYFNICVQYDIPFSTFDQLRAISRSSKVASRAFLFLGTHQLDTIEYVQKAIPEIEKDLGICFHWAAKKDWSTAINEIIELIGSEYYEKIIDFISSYMGEIGLQKLFKFVGGIPIKSESISQRNILDLRSQLGARVLKELPYSSPKVSSNYNIQMEDHTMVRLLLQAPIAVAESIIETQTASPIWGGDELRKIVRRNIQYSQYLCSLYPRTDFYNKIILHVLKRS